MENQNTGFGAPELIPADGVVIDGLMDDLLQLDIETFEIEELSDLDQHAAKSCTSCCSSTTSTTSCCSAAAN